MWYTDEVMPHTPHQKIIHHISRLEGQLASVKRELREAQPDCEKASKTLAAASRSFASLRRAFVTCFLGERYLKSAEVAKNVGEYEALLNIIDS